MTISVETSPSQRVAGEVRAELARKGLSVRRFAAASGLDEMWLSRRISASATRKVDMTLEDIELLAGALQVPVSRLVAVWLPRLDSNQQPSDYTSVQVSGSSGWVLAA